MEAGLGERPQLVAPRIPAFRKAVQQQDKWTAAGLRHAHRGSVVRLTCRARSTGRPTIGSSTLRLIEATAVSAEFGMTGKICLTPDQCSVVNEGLSPSQDEISWAKEFFAEFDRDGGEIRNGSDLSRIARAKKILDLARAYGIEVSEFDDEPVHMPAPSDTYHY